MTYSTLMVYSPLGQKNNGVLDIAGDLAERFRAHAIGILARQPMQVAYGGGYGYVDGDIVQADRDEIAKEFAAAEAQFRHALESRAKSISFRSSVTYGPLSDYLAREARSADLVITRFEQKRPLIDSSRYLDGGDLLMSLGRPVLNIPERVERLKLDHVLIAWKDTAESRRAVVNALPLLEAAGRVTVLEVAPERELEAAKFEVDDVVAWLGRHGIGAQSMVQSSTGDDAARIAATAASLVADVIVAGAYGHHRLRELALGGVTRDFLMHGDRCTLLSH